MLQVVIKETELKNQTLTKELTNREKTVQELKSTQDKHKIEVKDLKQEILILERKLKKARNLHFFEGEKILTRRDDK